MITFETFVDRFNNFRALENEPKKISFLFGLIVTSRHHIFERRYLTQQHIELSHSLFTEENKEVLLPTILKTWSGEDDNGQSEMDYKEEGKPSLMYMLERAKEMGRPNYCLFFILGLVRGYANSKWIDESEVKEILGAFPSRFIEENQELARHWFEYFDEVGVYLKI